MSTAFKKAMFVLAALAVFAACTPRSPQMGLIPPPPGITRMDDTPPPCPTCDSDGGMPR
jgi:uncharacterized lipoprotein YajG